MLYYSQATSNKLCAKGVSLRLKIGVPSEISKEYSCSGHNMDLHSYQYRFQVHLRGIYDTMAMFGIDPNVGNY